MKKLVRAAALSLAALLAAGSLASCGLFGGGKKLPDKQTVDHVYKYEQQKIYSTKNNYGNDGSTESSDGYEYVYDYAANADGYVFLVNKADKDYNTTAFTMHYGKYDGNDKTVELEIPQNQDDSIYYSSMARFADGFGVIKQRSILLDAETYSYQEETLLEIYGEDGQPKSSIDLRQALGIEGDKWFGVNRMLLRDDLLYLLVEGEDGTGFQRLSLDGTLGTPLEVFPAGTEGYVNNAFFSGENELVVAASTYGANESKQVLIFIDLTTGARTEVDTKNDYQLTDMAFADASGKLYSADSNGIYEVDKTTLEKTELMNYINSDYSYNYGNFTALSDGRFASMTSEYDNANEMQNYYVNLFTKVPDSEIQPKYIITVASAGAGYNLQKQIVKFNLASDEYRIKYIDYSQYNTDEDYTLGQTKLGDDILAGNVPDILIADSQFSVSKYVNKGLFADLYTFMDKDESTSRSDFLENILTGCEIDGKLYEIPTNFYIMGFIGPKDKLAEYKNLTLREFADKVAALPEGVSFIRDGDYNRKNMLQQLFLINYPNFVDLKTGKCSINNDEFRALLEYVKTLPEKTMWEDENFDYSNFDWDAYNNVYKDGKAIAQMSSLDSFSSLQDYAYNFGGDIELDFVGIPSPDREGMGFTASDLKFLVSAKGAFPDAAWDFVKIFLSDDYQTEQSWGFPVRKSALDTMKQKALDEIRKREEEAANGGDGEVDGDIVVRPAVTEASASIDPGYPDRQVTAEDVETVYNYVLSAKKQLVYDTSLFDIIDEETSAYFAGTKSLDEILPLMESRINIFLAEGR